jgi:hypothetical protein
MAVQQRIVKQLGKRGPSPGQAGADDLAERVARQLVDEL